MKKRIIIYLVIFFMGIIAIIAVYIRQKTNNNPDLPAWTKETPAEKTAPPYHAPSSLKTYHFKPPKPLTKEEIMKSIQEKQDQMAVQQESPTGPGAGAALEEREKQMAIQGGTLTRSEARKADREKRKNERGAMREARRKEREAKREARKKARDLL